MGRDQAVVRRAKSLQATSIALSAIVLSELLFGALRSKRIATNVQAIEALGFTVVPFTREDARQAAEIRSELAAIGRLIGPYDILIAAQARARDLTIVTRNVREFERVQGLRLEAW